MTSLKKLLFTFLLYLMIFPLYLNQSLSAEEGKSFPTFSIKNSRVDTVSQRLAKAQKDTQKEQTASGSQPHLEILSPAYDAGEVWEGHDIIHSFTIKNTGTAELTIKNVKSG